MLYFRATVIDFASVALIMCYNSCQCPFTMGMALLRLGKVKFVILVARWIDPLTTGDWKLNCSCISKMLTSGVANVRGREAVREVTKI